jgi:hypothetical protein
MMFLFYIVEYTMTSSVTGYDVYPGVVDNVLSNVNLHKTVVDVVFFYSMFFCFLIG